MLSQIEVSRSVTIRWDVFCSLSVAIDCKGMVALLMEWFSPARVSWWTLWTRGWELDKAGALLRSEGKSLSEESQE